MDINDFREQLEIRLEKGYYKFSLNGILRDWRIFYFKWPKLRCFLAIDFLTEQKRFNKSKLFSLNLQELLKKQVYKRDKNIKNALRTARYLIWDIEKSYDFKYEIAYFNSKKYVYLIIDFELVRQYHNITQIGICEKSKHLFIKYITMWHKAGLWSSLQKSSIKHIAESPLTLYLNMDLREYELDSLRIIFNKIRDNQLHIKEFFKEKEIKHFPDKYLWIPNLTELQDLIFYLSNDTSESLKIKYQTWRKKNKISYKSEEINWLAFLMNKKYNKKWDKEKKKWRAIYKEIEFRINDFITLKLEENGKTEIYIKENGRYEKFIQCKYLLMNFDLYDYEQMSEQETINSIDEAASRYSEGLEHNTEGISAIELFRGHCSNIQVWYENEYDTRILHSNIAFPLLKILSRIGDPLAKKVFKEEIVKRVESNFKPVILFLINGFYFNYLNKEEIKVVIDIMKSNGHEEQYHPLLYFKLLLNRFIEMERKIRKAIKLRDKYGFKYPILNPEDYDARERNLIYSFSNEGDMFLQKVLNLQRPITLNKIKELKILKRKKEKKSMQKKKKRKSMSRYP